MPVSTPGSWSASTSTRGHRSRARARSPGRSWARSGRGRPCPFGTAVTCPGFRYHPAVIAHAAATLGAMFPGRFWLGLGAGEALNEHIVGGEWPEIGVRSAMLFEAIEIINKLFTGAVVTQHRGEHFTLESAKLYTRPETAGHGLRRDGRAGQRQADRQVRRRDDHGRGRRREDRDALGEVRRGRPRGRQGPLGTPKLLQIHVSLGADRRGGDRQRDARVAQRRDAVPEAGHQEPRGLRGDGQAGPARGLHEPLPDDLRPRARTPSTSSTTSTWASTRSTSTTSGATRRSSSRSSGARCCRTSAWADPVADRTGSRGERAAGCPGRTCGRCRRSGPAWSGRP